VQPVISRSDRLHSVIDRTARTIASGVAGALRRGMVPGFTAEIASVIAEKTEIASGTAASSMSFER